MILYIFAENFATFQFQNLLSLCLSKNTPCSFELPEDNQCGQFGVATNFRSGYCHPLTISKDAGHLFQDKGPIILVFLNAGNSVVENSNGKNLEGSASSLLLIFKN